jgi:hypothetical protein
MEWKLPIPELFAHPPGNPTWSDHFLFLRLLLGGVSPVDPWILNTDATLRLMIRTKGIHGNVPLLVPARLHSPPHRSARETHWQA